MRPSSSFPGTQSIRHLSNNFPHVDSAAVETSVAGHFDRLTASISERTAIVTNGQKYTYAELNQAASRVASSILERMRSTDSPVALLLSPGFWLSAAILGVLRAGGFYVVLKASNPVARIRFLLEDSRTQLLVADDSSLALARELAVDGLPLATVDELAASGHSTGHWPHVNPDCPAGLTYTSGSTGTPKGVIHSHRYLMHRALAGRRLAIAPGDRVASVGASSSMFRALLNGASAIPWNLKREGLAHLADWLRHERITVLHAIPGVFREFAASFDRNHTFPDLRLINLRGEALFRRDVEFFQEAIGGSCVLVNEFGTSETGTIAQFVIDVQTSFKGDIAPVGRVFQDKKVTLLAEDGHSVEQGEVGEIAVQSRYLSPGYWGQPELTRSRFRPDPTGGDARIYLTGDLGRFDADGMLVHVGRNDSQVKVRAQRVELGEIEAALRQLDRIREAAVVAREDRSGDKRLVAYVVATGGPPPTVSALAQGLKARLPDHMIPSAFVVLDAMPRTPNGKINRLALPEPGAARPNLVAAHVAPQDPIEQQLAFIWSNVLGIEDIGIRDNFFELGGHSLLAVRLVDEIERRFGRRIPLDALWYHGPTVEHIADLLRQDEGAIAWPLLVPIKPAGNKPPLFCVHTRGGNLFHYDQLAHALDADQPMFGLQARGVYGRDAPRRSIGEIAADCIAAMQTRQPRGPYMIAGYSSGGWIAFEMARQLVAKEEHVALLALLDSFAPDTRRRSRRWWTPRNVLRDAGLRRIQERTYHAILNPMGLSRFRDLKKVGEAQRWAFWSYQAVPYRGEAHLLRAEESSGTAAEPALGWAPLVQGGVRVRQISGNHSSIMKPPQVVELAEVLQCLLDACS